MGSLFFDYEVHCKPEKGFLSHRLFLQIDNRYAYTDILHLDKYLDVSKKNLREIIIEFFSKLDEIYKMKKKYHNYEEEKGFFAQPKDDYKLKVNNKIEKANDTLNQMKTHLSAFRILSSLFLSLQSTLDQEAETIDFLTKHYGAEYLREMYSVFLSRHPNITEKDVESLLDPIREEWD